MLLNAFEDAKLAEPPLFLVARLPSRLHDVGVSEYNTNQHELRLPVVVRLSSHTQFGRAVQGEHIYVRLSPSRQKTIVKYSYIYTPTNP